MLHVHDARVVKCRSFHLGKAGAPSSAQWSMHNLIPAKINPTNSLTAMHVMSYL